MEFTVTSTQILGFCTFVGGLWAVWKIVKELKKPNDDMKKKLEDHERKLTNDDKRLKEIEQADKMILQCLLVIINHDITGNCIDRLKETRDELQEFLIKK